MRTYSAQVIPPNSGTDLVWRSAGIRFRLHFFNDTPSTFFFEPWLRKRYMQEVILDGDPTVWRNMYASHVYKIVDLLWRDADQAILQIANECRLAGLAYGGHRACR